MRIVLRSMVILAVGMLLLGWGGDAEAQSSANYQISRSVVSSGGGRSASTSYALTGTLGQSSPIDVSESSTYNLGSGFWGGMVKMFTVAIESITYSIGEGVRITWQSFAGASYTVYFTDSLTAAWTAVATPFTGTGGLMEWLDDGTETGSHPGLASVLKRFYRLRGQPAE